MSYGYNNYDPSHSYSWNLNNMYVDWLGAMSYDDRQGWRHMWEKTGNADTGKEPLWKQSKWVVASFGGMKDFWNDPGVWFANTRLGDFLLTAHHNWQNEAIRKRPGGKNIEKRSRQTHMGNYFALNKKNLKRMKANVTPRFMKRGLPRPYHARRRIRPYNPDLRDNRRGYYGSKVFKYRTYYRKKRRRY